jgi:hypothetical protein
MQSSFFVVLCPALLQYLICLGRTYEDDSVLITHNDIAWEDHLTAESDGDVNLAGAELVWTLWGNSFGKYGEIHTGRFINVAYAAIYGEAS